MVVDCVIVVKEEMVVEVLALWMEDRDRRRGRYGDRGNRCVDGSRGSEVMK